ncbi:MAG: ketoacyl-ACP synthase III [Actinobacteria bacterium]|nr:ketoacyl-ACP synthase III [Actinomycetota bacterium]
MRACIAGWGSAVPEGRLTNADLEARVETSDEWIVERTGIRERRVATEDETTASLAIAAGAAAIKSAGITPEEVDQLVVATATPEQPIPHTGAFVGDGLGLRCGSFDMNVGCAGFIYGLVAGAALLQAGNLRHVLVIGAETLSRIVDPRDRGTCILFGDGAAAVVLAPTGDDGPGILGWDTGCDGSATGLLGIPAGGSRLPATSDTIDEGLQFIKMQGQEVFRRAVRAVVDSANLALERAGITAGDIDWFIPHQANLRIIEAAANRLGIDRERTIVNIERFGNTSAASIPLAMTEAADAGRLTDGDLILISGFGAGMSWGSAVLRWGRA